MSWRTLKFKFIRAYRYEYWPYLLFYFPMFLYGFLLAFKRGRLTYWSTTNPLLKHGGVFGISKYALLLKLPDKFFPKTLFLQPGESLEKIQSKMNEAGLKYPLIIKPDSRERGKSVEKIDTPQELTMYLNHNKDNVIIQEFIDYPIELGVLYYRIPGNEKGNISSVVEKNFLKISGDGRSTVEQLIDKDVRAVNRRAYLKSKFVDSLNRVLEQGETMMMEPIGNHNRGTEFINANHLINHQLETTFDNLAKHIDGFYYGRFDLKAQSIDDLYIGKNIKVMEINGISSEPAHIYDPGMHLLKAYAVIIKHMNIIYRISKINADRGVKYSSSWSFLKELKEYLLFDKFNSVA